MNNPSNRILRDLLAIGVLLSIVYLGFIGIRPFSHPDEGRYVEIPLEMVTEGDYITPRLNGVPYFYKPPLFYWLQAIAIKLTGISEWGLRFFPAFAAILTCMAVYLTGSRLWGRGTGIMAALILSSMGLFFGLSQIIILDMLLTAFISGALLAYIAGIDMQEGRTRKILFTLFYICLAAAVMTKGLVGLLIPALIIGTWTLWLRRWNDLKQVYLLPGILLFLFLTIPWHVSAAIANPADSYITHFFTTNSEGQGFLWFYIWHEHFLRYLIEDTSQRGEPFWYFLLIVPLGMLPWTVFIPSVFRKSNIKKISLKHPNSINLYLSLWFIFPIVFFSLSSSKLIPYILPVLPPTALLLGRYLHLKTSNNNLSRAPFTLLAIIALITCLVFPWIIADRRYVDSAVIPWIITLIVVFASCGSLLLIAVIKKRAKWWIPLVLSGTFGFFILFNGLAQYLQRPSTATFAQWIIDNADSDIEVMVAFNYFQDFPVYLGRTVSIIENKPTEQQFGLQRENHEHRYLSINELEQRIESNNPIVILIETKSLERISPLFKADTVRILKQNDHFTLLGNIK